MHLGVLTPVVGAIPHLPSHVVDVNATLGGKLALFGRYSNNASLVLAVQNPFANLSCDALRMAYAANLTWAPSVAGATYVADSALLGLTRRTGRTLPVPAPAVDEAERDAVAAMVAAFVAATPKQTAKINIGWTENDYEIDIANASGRDEYKRIIRRSAQLGIDHVLFAPRNTDVSSRDRATDAWRWEEILWFGLGEAVRAGTWLPGVDPIPASLAEMLAYFREQGVKPVAYVYPILAFGAGEPPGNTSTLPSWIINGSYADGAGAARLRENHGPLRATLASVEFQQYIVKAMLDFAEQTGAGGYSFDYTYFEGHESQYAQWAGWRAILRGLHAANPELVLDNRQLNHAWGPWMWAAGSYAEPLASDEQPTSWTFFTADLHTDRLSANRQRSVAWSYRNEHFAPMEITSGFAFHQTDRTPPTGLDPVTSEFYTKDFDLLGHRYSLLSSIATGGLNNVLCDIPARNASEFDLFPAAARAWIKDWLTWTDDRRALLTTTRTFAPAPGPATVDGTFAYDAKEGEGVAWLFNPEARPLPFTLPLGDAMGYDCASSPLPPAVLISERLNGSCCTSGATLALVDPCAGGGVNVSVPAASALVLQLLDAPLVDLPQLIGSVGTVTLGKGGALAVSGAAGEAGQPASLTVLLPPGAALPPSATVNGASAAVASAGRHSFGGLAVRLTGRWGGAPLRNLQEVGSTPPAFAGGEWSASLAVPPAALAQLKARNASYPLPYDAADANVSWLAPGRLLLWVKHTAIANDSFAVEGTWGGEALAWRRAYNTIVPNPTRFTGWFADVTAAAAALGGEAKELKLKLPPSGSALNWTALPGFISAGDDLATLPAGTPLADAQKACAAMPRCLGYTYHAACGPTVPGNVTIKLKGSLHSGGGADWCRVAKPPKLDGVFLENVETLTSAEGSSVNTVVREQSFIHWRARRPRRAAHHAPPLRPQQFERAVASLDGSPHLR